MNFPISALVAGVLGLIFMWLSVLVIKSRRANAIGIGDGENAHLQARIRIHGNFAEYVPVLLVLLFIAELNAAPNWLLFTLGGLMIYGRIAHAIGMSLNTGVTWQRITGMLATFASLIVLSALNLAMFVVGYFNL